MLLLPCCSWSWGFGLVLALHPRRSSAARTTTATLSDATGHRRSTAKKLRSSTGAAHDSQHCTALHCTALHCSALSAHAPHDELLSSTERGACTAQLPGHIQPFAGQLRRHVPRTDCLLLLQGRKGTGEAQQRQCPGRRRLARGGEREAEAGWAGARHGGLCAVLLERRGRRLD